MCIKFTGDKTETVKKLYSDILDILSMVGIPLEGLGNRRLEKMAGACLATAHIRTSLKEAESLMNGVFLKTRDIIEFENANYGESISRGSYDDIRRKDLKPLVEAGLVVNSAILDQSATNNPNRGYALDAQFAKLLHVYGTKQWDAKLAYFLETRKSLKEELERKRDLVRIPVTLSSGETLELSLGEHNLLQKKIIEDLLPLYGMGAQVLYIGDTNNKYLYRDDDTLKKLHFFTLAHGELPDVVAYNKEKNLLFLIEAYNSSGPMDEMRVRGLKRLLADCTAEVAFFTAFLNKEDFRAKANLIAWETEVWIAEAPEHLIHFNGYKFLDIHK